MKTLLLVCALALAGCGGRSAARQSQPAAPTAEPTLSAAEHGAMLFRNKGCITCHANARVPGPQLSLWEPGAGPPNLTDYRNDPAYLRRWLANPAAVKPATLMPNIGLTAEEIEDLIAFINAPR